MNDNFKQAATYYPLFVISYRYGGFYGLLSPGLDRANDIDYAIDYDKTSNLIMFLNQYECFPFAQGDSHEDVLAKINERTDKFFSKKGAWKIDLYRPGQGSDEGFSSMGYEDVWDMILEWFKEAGKTQEGTPWYVIDEKEREKHWLFDALAKEIKRVEETCVNFF